MFEKLFLSWLMAITGEYLLLPGSCRRLDGLEGISQMSGSRAVVVFLLSFLILSFFSRKLTNPKWEKAESLQASFTPAFFAACCLLFFWLLFGRSCPAPIHHMTNVRPTIKNTVSRKTTGKFFLPVTIFLSILFFLFLSLWTVSRIYCFSTPTYDFGIFSQMFHYMKTTGLPYTTLERDGLLSHFHVHISPIYYLLLPFYCLVPVPATLQVLQAAVITSSVIPLWKLGRHYGLIPFQRMLLCALFLFYPAFSGGVGYDIHENCFLTPLLLWLFYGIAKKNTWLIAAAAMLTMLVKEDAPVYVACIALWLTASSLPHKGTHYFPRNNRQTVQSDRWGIIAGSVMLFASLAYFFAASDYLTTYGDGLMTARYSNFFSGNDAAPLASLLKTALLCPMKVVYECADTDKLWFIAITILPLLGLPLFTRRWERYLLLIPYILINLMPDYAYQHDIFFQYAFGSAACLLYLTVINLADLRRKAAPSLLTTAALIAAAAVCAVCFTVTIVPKAVSYPARCISNHADYQELRRVLSRIPGEASVTASTFYTTFLSQRDILYDIRYASEEHLLSTEFVVLNPASEHDFKQYARDGKTGYEGLTELLYNNGYQLYTKVNGAAEIYRQLTLPQYSASTHPFSLIRSR